MSSVQLGLDLGIEAAAALKEQLAPHLSSDHVVKIEAQQVERVHTASVQVLCAFVRDRSGAGHGTHIEPCAEPLRDAARVLGVADHLGLTGPTDANGDKA